MDLVRLVVQAFGTTSIGAILLRTTAYKVGHSSLQPTPKPGIDAKYVRISLVFPPRANLGRREQYGGDGRSGKNETPPQPARSQGILTTKQAGTSTTET